MKNKNVFLLDDEHTNISWLVEWLNSKGCTTETAASADEALNKLEGKVSKFDCFLIDLNVPTSVHRGTGPIYTEYPGLAVAQKIRSWGVAGGKVVIYSVHLTPQLEVEIYEKLSCKYVVKGRPRELKSVLIKDLSL
ncbi:response regulator [Pseudoduganella violacea]|uniref:CheY-like chemotaxis protein n=1 Tax=Pseudoduganella violacea TaxID=1715466 RepID=A0A7W5FU84_9BURK|nr:response regulator [Pseudoduganella violacea]MBB3119660.1 CheY-like chemotaxis protein [Pseudoduganella violacea]